ncbi:MAG: hypothetical protein Q8M09_03095 [Pseudomonadota bacterium]|nr:hypothetical protein [Pseudomonadota bacterium]MDP1903221.1 hypothetical protein [Pseudomonadota bacterium]MDP2352730.1 hypothetical protein [Pseudomonadota bacterium]
MGQEAGKKWAATVAHCQCVQPALPKSGRLPGITLFVLLSLAAQPVFSRDADWDAWSNIQGKAYAALQAQGIADKDRILVHLAHTCSLKKGHKTYRVLEMRELVRGGPSPRGINYLVLMDNRFRVAAKVELGMARPYYCDAGKVILNLPVDIPWLGNTGNVLVLDDLAHVVRAEQMETSDMAGFRPKRSERH